jgi:hypothetical protein
MNVNTKRRRYSEASKEALVQIWKSINYMASRRLKVAFSDWLPKYQGCRELVKDELLRMSSKTMDRYLKSAKAVLKCRMNTGTRRGLRKMEDCPGRKL